MVSNVAQRSLFSFTSYYCRMHTGVTVFAEEAEKRAYSPVTNPFTGPGQRWKDEHTQGARFRRRGN